MAFYKCRAAISHILLAPFLFTVYNENMKRTIMAAAFALLSCLAFAQEPTEQDEIAEQLLEKNNSPHNFYIFADLAYLPYSGMVSGSGERFAPITGAYDSMQFGVTACYDYTIPLPGSKPLTKDNCLKFGGDIQISPATIKPRVFARYSPIAFLVFNTGFLAGTGWNFLGSQGLASYNPAKGEYDDLTPFKNWFCDFSVGATFQFDAAALWPGDWHHIVFMATYEFHLSGLTGQANGHPWCWATDYNMVNGPNYYANVILGYQMPKKISMVGLQAEFKGYYSDSQFDSVYKAFEGSFCNVDLSPFAVFSLTKKDTLFVLFTIERRKGFDTKRGFINGRDQNVLEMRCSGGEWYFKRIALRYIHNF